MLRFFLLHLLLSTESSIARCTFATVHARFFRGFADFLAPRRKSEQGCKWHSSRTYTNSRSTLGEHGVKKERAGLEQRFFLGSELFFGASGSIEVHRDEISCQFGHRTQSSKPFGSRVILWPGEKCRLACPTHALFPSRSNGGSVEKLNEEEQGRGGRFCWVVRAVASIAEFQTIERATHAKQLHFCP